MEGTGGVECVGRGQGCGMFGEETGSVGYRIAGNFRGIKFHDFAQKQIFRNSE